MTKVTNKNKPTTEKLVVKDSGNRTEFETGSLKDISFGRGRFDLIPLSTLASLYGRGEHTCIDEEEREHYNKIAWFLDNVYGTLKYHKVDKKIKLLEDLFYRFLYDFLDKDLTEVVTDLAVLYEAGAEKYEARDWEKGRPQEVFTDSILRHFFQYLNGETDEDHATAVLWNIISLIDTLKRLPSQAYTLPEITEEP